MLKAWEESVEIPVKRGRSGEAVQIHTLYYISYISCHICEMLGSAKDLAVVCAAVG